MANLEFDQKEQKIFPENTADIIDSLLEKYKLETIKGLFESFGPVKTSEEKGEFQKRWENLPGPKIAQILKEVSQDKIKAEELTSVLQNRLAISKRVAQGLAKDLQEKILGLLRVSEKPVPPKKPDIYREPIE